MIDLAEWPTLVLAAGLATRLRPLSDVRAKAALPVAGQPLIGRILGRLRDAGVRRVVVNLHHRPETVTRFVGAGEEWDLAVRYSWETAVLGSAGGPRRALPLLDAERFLIVNGDTLTDCDLRAVAGRHMQTGALVTMAVVEQDVDRIALVDDADSVVGFAAGDGRSEDRPTSDRPTLFRGHFIGVQAVNAAAFASVPDDEPYETVKQLYPRLIEAYPGSVRAYRSSAEFLDVGTPAGYLDTVRLVASRERRPLDRGAGCEIAPTASVMNSILWDRVRILDGARLTDCIVGDDVVIPAGTRYERCAIVSGADGLVVSQF